MKATPDTKSEAAIAHADSISEGQGDLLSYAASLARNAADSGMAGARRSDPDAHQAAQAAILEAIDRYGVASADDVSWPMRGNELGSGFSALHKAGVIEVAGYTTSKRQAAHGHLLRTWRRRL